MRHPVSASRRALLKRVAISAALAPLVARTLRPARAANPLVSPDSKAARAVKYVEDAQATPDSHGNRCATCALYQGPAGSTQGPCQLFPGEEVRAAGWCNAWAGQM